MNCLKPYGKPCGIIKIFLQENSGKVYTEEGNIVQVTPNNINSILSGYWLNAKFSIICDREVASWINQDNHGFWDSSEIKTLNCFGLFQSDLIKYIFEHGISIHSISFTYFYIDVFHFQFLPQKLKELTSVLIEKNVIEAMDELQKREIRLQKLMLYSKETIPDFIALSEALTKIMEPAGEVQLYFHSEPSESCIFDMTGFKRCSDRDIADPFDTAHCQPEDTKEYVKYLMYKGRIYEFEVKIGCLFVDEDSPPETNTRKIVSNFNKDCPKLLKVEAADHKDVKGNILQNVVKYSEFNINHKQIKLAKRNCHHLSILPNSCYPDDLGIPCFSTSLMEHIRYGTEDVEILTSNGIYYSPQNENIYKAILKERKANILFTIISTSVNVTHIDSYKYSDFLSTSKELHVVGHFYYGSLAYIFKHLKNIPKLVMANFSFHGASLKYLFGKLADNILMLETLVVDMRDTEDSSISGMLQILINKSHDKTKWNNRLKKIVLFANKCAKASPHFLINNIVTAVQQLDEITAKNATVVLYSNDPLIPALIQKRIKNQNQQVFFNRLYSFREEQWQCIVNQYEYDDDSGKSFYILSPIRTAEEKLQANNDFNAEMQRKRQFDASKYWKETNLQPQNSNQPSLPGPSTDQLYQNQPYAPYLNQQPLFQQQPQVRRQSRSRSPVRTAVYERSRPDDYSQSGRPQEYESSRHPRAASPVRNVPPPPANYERPSPRRNYESPGNNDQSRRNDEIDIRYPPSIEEPQRNSRSNRNGGVGSVHDSLSNNYDRSNNGNSSFVSTRCESGNYFIPPQTNTPVTAYNLATDYRSTAVNSTYSATPGNSRIQLPPPTWPQQQQQQQRYAAPNQQTQTSTHQPQNITNIPQWNPFNSSGGGGMRGNNSNQRYGGF